ncbi:MAG: response regulator transcription factor [Bacteroidales bacterium]|jgi:DNA-binding response OmpR family regulator|nr:response regulator transcription factor [Bacteroidales bacterium]
MSVKVLLAEDDKNLGIILKAYLEAKGYPTELCVNGEDAFEMFLKADFDFCIIDVMMPVKDGYTLAREIRKKNKTIPLIFLTAKSMQDDKLRGFEVGADDYITKPFSMEELMVRMQAILRRSDVVKPADNELKVYKLGNSQFDYTRQLLRAGDKEYRLTSKEAALLQVLCDNINEVVDRSLALRRVWDDDSYFSARSMDVYVTKLRKYFKTDPSVQILNVHGVGFKLVSEVH